MHLPTTDGRTVLLSRYTEPELDQLILLRQLKIDLPAQPSPRICLGRRRRAMTPPCVVPTFDRTPWKTSSLAASMPRVAKVGLGSRRSGPPFVVSVIFPRFLFAKTAPLIERPKRLVYLSSGMHRSVRGYPGPAGHS